MRPVYILELQVHTTRTKNLSDGTNHPMGLAFLRVLFKVERHCGKRIQDSHVFPGKRLFCQVPDQWLDTGVLVGSFHGLLVLALAFEESQSLKPTVP